MVSPHCRHFFGPSCFGHVLIEAGEGVKDAVAHGAVEVWSFVVVVAAHGS